MAQAPVTMQRMPDARYHVMDANGQVLGMHNTPWSAARQMHEYYSDQSDSGEGGESQGGMGVDEHPPVPRPAIPRPKKDTAPSEAPKRIPRP